MKSQSKLHKSKQKKQIPILKDKKALEEIKADTKELQAFFSKKALIKKN